jgi:ABC-type glutathione transport system ATPase component
MTLLTVSGLTVRRGKPGRIVAENIDLSVPAGGALGLVGESGCGKSSVLRALAGLSDQCTGTITLAGVDLPPKRNRTDLRRMQMVFQDPYASLHPRLTVAESLAEPLIINNIGDVSRRISDVVQSVGLDPALIQRFPNQLSGGQRQRAAIARALLLEPDILLLDEPTSALDVSVQAGILELLAQLRRERGIAYILVSHDLAVVAELCDDIMVMQAGRIVETVSSAALRRHDVQHPHSKNLLSAHEGFTSAHRIAAVKQDDAPLLQVKNLRVCTGDRILVDSVSFTLGREKLGIVGESGSGKSLTSRAILGVQAANCVVTADQIAIMGADTLAMSSSDRRRHCARNTGMVLQDPRYSLNPVMTVGAQIAEVGALLGLDAAASRQRAIELLAAVDIPDPERVADLYPYEISGGMGQRAMIAMMLFAEPKILIADEPTSALDTTSQITVLSMMDDLVSSRGMGLIMISHDLRLVTQFCDRVLIMQHGRIVEEIAGSDAAKATHPYSQQLFAATKTL